MRIATLDSVVRQVNTVARFLKHQLVDNMSERSELIHAAKYFGKGIRNTVDVVSDYVPNNPRAYALGALLLACSPDLSNLGGSRDGSDAGTDAVGMTGDGPDYKNDDCPGKPPRQSCGLNGRGNLEYACRDRQYEVVGCNDPDVCTDGKRVMEACGLNDRGTRGALCIEGKLEPDPCNDPDVCVDTTTDATACGYNGNGTQSRSCIDGQYGPFGDCVDPDECADGTTETRPCSTDVGVCVVGTETYGCASSGPGKIFRMVALGDCDGVLPSSEDSNDDGGCTVADLNGLDEDCDGIVENGPCMVPVAAGEFSMGCDASYPFPCGVGASLHTIDVSDYSIDKFEVTNGQYQICEGLGACTPPGANSSFTRGSYYNAPAFDGHPVIYVTWSQAEAYCAWAGKRLPTEAEWEKAAKGASPSSNSFPWGSDSPDCDRANYNNCMGDTVAAGSYPSGASPFGAMDMAGNVAEWVNDWYDESYYPTSPTTDPLGPGSGTNKVRRGGNFTSTTSSGGNGVSTYFRLSFDPTSSHFGIGFRCAKDDLEDL